MAHHSNVVFLRTCTATKLWRAVTHNGIQCMGKNNTRKLCKATDDWDEYVLGFIRPRSNMWFPVGCRSFQTFWIQYLLKRKCRWHDFHREYSIPIFSRPYYGRAIGTVLRLSVCLSVTLCILAKRCVLEQKLLLRAYRKSYMRNRLVPKWMTLTFV